MAKRKKSSKKRSRRGRRVSGFGGSAIMNALTIAGGAVVAKFAADKIAVSAPSIKPNMLAAGEIIIGALLAGTNNPLVQKLGYGFIGLGGIDLAKSFGVVSGIGYNPGLVEFRAAPQLNGMESTIAGNESDEYDFDGSDGMGGMQILAGTGY